MRVLFTTWAWPSHLYPLVPLAWAARAAGHDVLVASQPELLGEIAAAGLPGVAVGADVDAVDLVRGYVLPSQGDQGGAAPRTGKGPRAMQMFLAHAESMTGGLIEVARSWGADLVVYEPTALAGPIAAAAVGVPAVRHLYGTDLMQRARPVLAGMLAPLAARHGVTEVDPYGVLTVDPTPPALQLPADDHRVTVRHLAYCGAAPALPVPAPRLTGRPRVCVTWGHTMAKLDESRFLAPAVVRALARDPGLDVVAAVSEAQRPLLGALPPGVSAVVGRSLDDLLPGCDAVVAHGGAGTVLTAVRHAVPMLLVPQLPDHTGHASRVLATGAGEVLTRDQADAATLLDRTRWLVSDPAPRTAVQALSEQMRAAPAPAEIVERLAAVAAGTPKVRS